MWNLWEWNEAARSMVAGGSKGAAVRAKRIGALAVAAAVMTLAACASSHVIVGVRRPAISPGDVVIYLSPPAKYEEIALINTTSRGSWSLSAQKQTDWVVERLKVEAATLGANGVLLQSVSERQGSSIVTGTSARSGGGALAVGSVVGISDHAGTGIAIFVPKT